MDPLQIKQTIDVLETQRSTLGHTVVNTAIMALRKLLGAPQPGSTFYPVEQKRITVLFATISGLSAFTATMDQKTAYQTLNALWARLDAVITQHQGDVDAHWGNALVAYFGLNVARQNEPEWAIRAALNLQSTLQDFLREWADRQPDWMSVPDLQLTVGINTGPVLRGQFGTVAKTAVLGETIWVANQLENSAAPGSIFISQQTYQRVRGVFYVQQLAPISFKGQAQPLKIYAVKGAKPYTIRVISRSVEGVETSIAGRKTELEQLKHVFYTVRQQHRPGLVTVVGEAGIGKSRLLYELDRWLSQQTINIKLFQGRASQQTNQLPYWVIRDIFGFYFGIFASDSALETQKKLTQGISGVTDHAPDEMAPYIAHLIGFNFPLNQYLLPLLNNPARLHQQAVDYVAQFFAAMATDNSLVMLVLEDIHWADHASLQLIQHLVAAESQTPLLIVCSAQPSLFDHFPHWGKHESRYMQLNLKPLAPEESYQLVDDIFRKIPDPPGELRARVAERAQGNPLFLEELVQLLVDRGTIVPSPAHWHIEQEQLKKIDLPQSLPEVFEARINLIPPLEREILQRASIIGRAFWNVAVAEIGAEEAAEIGVDIINVVLDRLQERGLILKRKASPFVQTSEYVFKHTLLQEVIYRTIPRATQVAYHLRVAAWLIKKNGEQVDAYAALIASHYQAAGKDALAAEWFTRAGKQAQNAYALQMAGNHYRQARKLWVAASALTAGQRALQAHTLLNMVTVLLWQAETLPDESRKFKVLQSALDAAQSGVQIAQQKQHPALLAAAWLAMALATAQIPSGKTSVANSAQCFDRSLQFAVSAEDSSLRHQILQLWAEYEFKQGHRETGEKLLQQANTI